MIEVKKNCPKHKGQVLMLFCKPCEASICIQCKLTSHEGHQTEDVADAGERDRAELKEEIDVLAQREQTLKALLAKGEDFKAELKSEQLAAGSKIRTRSEQLQSKVSQVRDKSLESLQDTAGAAMAALQDQIRPVEEAHEAVFAKRQHYSKVLNDEDDSKMLALLGQRKKAGQGSDEEQTEQFNRMRIERCTIQHIFSEGAITESDVIAYMGTAAEGEFTEVKIQTVNTLKVEETASSGSTSHKTRGTTAGNLQQAAEIVYSKNPQATMVDMCLAAEEKVWVVHQYGKCRSNEQQRTALFDNRGQMQAMRHDSIYSDMRLACEGDTLVSLKDGKFFAPDGKTGNLGHKAFDDLHACQLSHPSRRYYVLKRGQVQVQTANMGNNVLMYHNYFDNSPLPSVVKTPMTTADIYPMASVTSAPPMLETDPLCSDISDGTILAACQSSHLAFAVSADEQFLAFNYGPATYVYIRCNGSSKQLKQIAAYTVQGWVTIDDCIFCLVGGEEMLLVASSGQNAVHIVDHKDGCCFIRTLESDQRPLEKPFRLATNHKGRVWVGCHGGKVVIFDL